MRALLQQPFTTRASTVRHCRTEMGQDVSPLSVILSQWFRLSTLMLVTSERDAREESVMQGHSAMLKDSSHRKLWSLLSVCPLQDTDLSTDPAVERKLHCKTSRIERVQGTCACLMNVQRSLFKRLRLWHDARAAMPLSSSSGRHPRSRLTRHTFSESARIPAKPVSILASSFTAGHPNI